MISADSCRTSHAPCQKERGPVATMRTSPRELTLEQQHLLLEACPPDLGRLVRAALLTACRLGELARLRVRDYSPYQQTIHLEPGKTGQARELGLTEDGDQFFCDLSLGRNGEELLFLKRSGRPMPSRDGNGVPCGWLQFDVKRQRNKVGKQIGIGDLHFHDLRTTWVSNAVARGLSIQCISSQLGHSQGRRP